MTPDNLILALDVNSPDEALRWVERLKGKVGCFKVGLQLFTQSGPDLVREIRKRGAEVFLDLKFHDIPNTVAKAVESVAGLDVRYLTIHTLGGSAMMEAACKACPERTTLLGVTVLTSHDDEDLRELGLNHTTAGQVALLARMAQEAGLRGLVCSAMEVETLRHILGSEMKLITPGVRPAGSEKDDQSRVTTPQEAIEKGSTAVVIGRPILKASDPEGLVESLLDQKA